MENGKLRVDLRPVQSGKLKAFADVTIPSVLGDLMILGFRVIHEDEKHPWVGFPSNSYPKDGKIVNKRLLDISGRAKREIAKAVLLEYENAQTVSKSFPPSSKALTVGRGCTATRAPKPAGGSRSPLPVPRKREPSGDLRQACPSSYLDTGE